MIAELLVVLTCSCSMSMDNLHCQSMLNLVCLKHEQIGETGGMHLVCVDGIQENDKIRDSTLMCA